MRDTNMVASLYPIRSMDQNRVIEDYGITIRYASGIVAGDIRFYASQAPDGAICAQLELRSEDIPMSYIADSSRLDFARHAFGRTGVLVSVDPPERFAPAMRFSINIPSEGSRASYNTRYGEAASASVLGEGGTIQTLRTGRRYPGNGSDRIRKMAENRRMRELADDRRKSVVGALSSLAHAISDPSTRA